MDLYIHSNPEESLLPKTPFPCTFFEHVIYYHYIGIGVDIMWPDENWVTTEAQSAQLS